MADQTPLVAPPPWRVALPRVALRLAVIIALVWGARWAFMAVYDWIGTLEDSAQSNAMIGLIALSLAAYGVLIAIPFVPAVEIGIALLVMEGASVAPFVYLATVLGLFLAYMIGQFLSLDWLHRFFRDLHMIKACMLLQSIQTEDPGDRLARLNARLPNWIAPLATRYRYITIGVLLSVPGNFAIGGGGGIMMIAGISRLFSAPKMLLTLVIAVAPIPLIVFTFGVTFFT